jgi:ribosomal protein S18 acetylase RimI-like enzyme
MLALEQAALQAGCAEMHLSVRPDNLGAVRFYEKLGWKRVRDAHAWGGKMSKKLDREFER